MRSGVVGWWVSCDEEMPDDEITVFVWFGGEATLAHHDSELLEQRGDSGWIQCGTNRVLLNVSHWCMEICEPEGGVEV